MIKLISGSAATLQKNTFEDIIRLSVVGWFFGVTSIMLPLLLLFSIPNSFGGMWWEPILIVLMVPFIAFCQSWMIGIILVLGLKVFRAGFLKEAPSSGRKAG